MFKSIYHITKVELEPRPWFANRALFDYLDIQRWHVYLAIIASFALGFIAGIAL